MRQSVSHHLRLVGGNCFLRRQSMVIVMTNNSENKTPIMRVISMINMWPARNKECQDKINQGMRMSINGKLHALLWCSYFEEQFGDIERNWICTYCTYDFSWEAVAGKGLILWWRGNQVLFLELRWDSWVTKGNSGFLLCWPREVQSSIRVVRESGGLLSSYRRAKETSSRLVSRT